MKRFLRGVLTQRLAVYAVVAVLAIAGLLSVRTLPESLYPPLEFSRINVRAENGDLAPSLVQTAVTRPLERLLATLPGVVAVKAQSTQGTADVYVSFDPRQTPGTLALQRVSTAIATVEASLPRGTVLHVAQITSNLFPVVTYALTSARLDTMQLREAAENEIKPRLTGLPDIAAVGVIGGDVREYVVALDPQRLASRGVAIDQVTSAIAKTNTITAVGHTDAGYIRSTVLASGLAHDAASIAAIPVTAKGDAVVTVGAVATVSQEPAPPSVTASSDDRPAVLLNVFPQPGSSYVNVSATIARAMRDAVPPGSDIRVVKFWDMSTLVSDAIASLRDAILVGLVLSTLVLFFFLRNLRSTLIAAAIIPLTIVTAFVAMRAFGQGLNLMTLGGLAVGVGLIIDDAIVVIENINRHLGRGEEQRAAVTAAVAEIAVPMTSSTLTTIVVFAPLSLLSGVAGSFFQALSVTLTISLVISLALAFVLTPNFAAAFLRPRPETPNALVSFVLARYTTILRAALRRRTAVIAGGIAVLAVTVLAGMRLGSDFLPALDEGAFETTFTLPPGTTLAETQRVERIIENIIDRDPAMASSAGVIGASMTLVNTDTPAGVNGGTIRETMKRGPRASIGTVMDRIGDRIAAAVPSAQFTNRQLLQDSLNDLSNQAAPIEVRLLGPEQSVLVPLATTIARRIAPIDGITGVFSGVTYHNPNVVVRADPSALALGVDPGQFAEDAAVLFGGSLVSQVIKNPLTIPVRVRYERNSASAPEAIENIPYVTPSGAVVPLSRVATIERAPPQADITELNGRQYIGITAQINGSNLGAIVAAIRARLADVRLPPGYTYDIGGAYELQQTSFGEFATAIEISVALVFIVMVVQFRSFLQPLAILTAVPLSVFGAVLVLGLTHITLNVSSLMGIILLVGLVVKNGILLLEYAAHNMRGGQAVEAALIDAARVRLRPIVMTTMTALLGMVPLAFALGSGSELLQPLAVVVIGGLSFSTLFTLLFVPAAFAMLADPRRRSPSARDARAVARA